MKLSKNSWHYKCLTKNVSLNTYHDYAISDFCTYVKKLILLFIGAIFLGVLLGFILASVLSVFSYWVFDFGYEGLAGIGTGVLIIIVVGVGGPWLEHKWNNWFPPKTWQDELLKKARGPSKPAQIYDSIKNKYCICLEFVDKE